MTPPPHRSGPWPARTLGPQYQARLAKPRGLWPEGRYRTALGPHLPNPASFTNRTFMVSETPS